MRIRKESTFASVSTHCTITIFHLILSWHAAAGFATTTGCKGSFSDYNFKPFSATSKTWTNRPPMRPRTPTPVSLVIKKHLTHFNKTRKCTVELNKFTHRNYIRVIIFLLSSFLSFFLIKIKQLLNINKLYIRFVRSEDC